MRGGARDAGNGIVTAIMDPADTAAAAATWVFGDETYGEQRIVAWAVVLYRWLPVAFCIDG